MYGGIGGPLYTVTVNRGHQFFRILSGALFPIVLFVLCLPESAISQAPEVEVLRQPEYQEIQYCLAVDDCRLCWKTHLNRINRGIVQSRTRCTKSLEDQLDGLSALMTEIVNHDPNGASLHTLFWGRLVPDTPQDDLKMAMRLALAAFKSDQWDRKKGKPVQGETVYWVRDLANSVMIYPELRKLFNSFDRRIKVAGVEKVLVLPAGRLPFFEKLKAHGVREGDKLPYDCLTWFSISP
jgi:hypothetical protein